MEWESIGNSPDLGKFETRSSIMIASFKQLEAYPTGCIVQVFDSFSSESTSEYFEINAAPENFDLLAVNPAFDFWNDPKEDIYEDA
jgi:hypothetical protein